MKRIARAVWAAFRGRTNSDHHGDEARCGTELREVTGDDLPIAGEHILAADDDAGQHAVINAEPNSRVLVDAPPGSGKTETAARRLAALISNTISPGQILALSFSRSAVRTLTKRLSTISDPRLIEELRHVSIRTFDAWAFRILRLAGCRPEHLLARSHDENIEKLTELIKGPRRQEIRTLIGDKRCLIVDEFQDLPGVRGDLVLALMELIAPPGKGGAGFTVLGDPAQAIFGFAGRMNGNEVAFPTPREYWDRIRTLYGDELKRITLTTNHRASGSIAEISSEMRAILMSDRSETEKLEAIRVKLASLSEREALARTWLEPAQGSEAILTRTNGEALRVLQRLFGDEVSGGQTPVRLRAAGYASLPPAWIGALLRKLRAQGLARSQFVRIHETLTRVWDHEVQRALELPDVDTAWSRLARASGAADDASSIDIGALRERLSWPDAFPDDQHVADDGIVVTTIHQSKGMEFDIVTLLEGQREDDKEASVGAVEEEANVAYVAVTRAASALARLPSDSIYRAPSRRSFRDERERLCHWWNGWVNLEMGIRGDIDPVGFVDPELHGGEKGVEALQRFLLENARALEGHKVILVKSGTGANTTYNICLQDNRQPGRIIGRTAKQLQWDLLDLLWERGYSLPGWIMNLRISTVGTATARGDAPLGEPERTSRLWLGIGLYGTGDFKPRKRDRVNAA
jgi:hypothetical protein